MGGEVEVGLGVQGEFANENIVRLAREDGDKELSGSLAKRDMELEARSLWDAVNGRPGEVLYAGAFDGN